MKWSKSIDKALEITKKQHRGQLRKDGETPYILHPLTVAWKVSEYTDDENTIIAALLHDVVEDTVGYGVEEIKRDFGEVVAKNVTYLSKNVGLPKIENNWLENKRLYVKRLTKADNEVLLIYIIDRIDNLNSLKNELETYGDKFWNKFNGKKEEKRVVEELSWKLFENKNLPQKLCSEFEQLFKTVYY